MGTLPQPNTVALTIVIIVALIVLYDVWALYRNRHRVPLLGQLTNGGYAWSSSIADELRRNGPNILTMLTMIGLPWLLANKSGTNESYIVLFDILLFIHLISLLIPKRYAITRTHLFADGHSYSWSYFSKLKWKKSQRLILQRKGWWLFAPLPLGGTDSNLEEAANRIYAAQEGRESWHLLIIGLNNEEE